MIAAFFDVDRTLLPRTSMEQQFIRWLAAHGHLTARDLLRAGIDITLRLPAYALQGYVEYHNYLRRQKQEDVERWATRCFEERILPRVSAEGRKALAEHRAAGHMTILLSGSIQPLVSRLGVALGADLAVGTELEVVEGHYTGRLIGKHVASRQKVVRVRELAEQYGLDLTRSYCYADHSTDLAMLEAFGHPAPTNPHPKLAVEARRRGWEIRWFR